MTRQTVTGADQSGQLSPALQDYLEAIRHLLEEQITLLSANQPVGFIHRTTLEGVRITDIAALLGTRLPTVVRSVARLRQLGLADQAERGPVRLTPAGAALAEQLAHRHADTVRFLTEVLGVTTERAAADACVIEHGLSGESAQRLHELLERWDMAPAWLRRQLLPPELSADGTAVATEAAPDFHLLGAPGGAGSRA